MKQKQTLIIIGTFLIQFIVFNIANNLIPLLLPTIMQYRGIMVGSSEAALYNLVFTVGIFVSAVVSPIVPQLFSKIGLKITFLAGMLIASLSFVGLGLIPNTIALHPQIYLSWVCGAGIYIGSVIISSIGIPFILTKWFNEAKKGSVMGFVFMGGGIGNLLCNMLLQIPGFVPSMNNFKFIFMIFGIISVVGSFIIASLFIKQPTTEESNIITQENEAYAKQTGSTGGKLLKEVIKTPKFMFFVLGLFFVGLFISGISLQYNVFYNQLAHNSKNPNIYLQFAFLFALFSIIGNFIGGKLFDKIGPLKTTIYASILMIIASICLITQNLNLGYVFGVCFGLGVFSYLLLPGYLVGNLFGSKDYGNILGIANMLFAIGFGVGGFIFSKVNQFQGWQVSWIMVLVDVIIGFSCLVVSIRQKLQ